MIEVFQKVACMRCGVTITIYEKTNARYFHFVSPDGICGNCQSVLGTEETRRLMLANIEEKGTALARYLPFVRKLECVN